jgi:regulator of CtrA degradation
LQAETTVFNRTYDETLDLIVEARNYLTYVRPHFRSGKTAMHDLRTNCEALRVTSRLTQVMAWLMIQRALSEGEISASEACAEKNRLSGHAVCLDVTASDDPCLPPGLRSLLGRSLQLYQRIARLEQMVIGHLLQ